MAHLIKYSWEEIYPNTPSGSPENQKTHQNYMKNENGAYFPNMQNFGILAPFRRFDVNEQNVFFYGCWNNNPGKLPFCKPKKKGIQIGWKVKKVAIRISPFLANFHVTDGKSHINSQGIKPRKTIFAPLILYFDLNDFYLSFPISNNGVCCFMRCLASTFATPLKAVHGFE